MSRNACAYLSGVIEACDAIANVVRVRGQLRK